MTTARTRSSSRTTARRSPTTAAPFATPCRPMSSSTSSAWSAPSGPTGRTAPEHLRAGLALPAVCRLWRRVTSEREGGFWQSMLQARWPPATSLLCSPKDVVLLSPGAIDSAQAPASSRASAAGGDAVAAAAAAAEAPAGGGALVCACAPQRVRWATLAAAAKARAGAARAPTGPGAKPSTRSCAATSRAAAALPPRDDLPAAARRGLDVVRAGALWQPVAPVDAAVAAQGHRARDAL